MRTSISRIDINKVKRVFFDINQRGFLQEIKDSFDLICYSYHRVKETGYKNRGSCSINSRSQMEIIIHLAINCKNQSLKRQMQEIGSPNSSRM